ncbi:hypothetical protein FQA39_LY02410 [Lamprigera yunnana]|nr:hypothetical protein FQA39_LY02410 [Lamprigera yunnana]
MNLEMELMGIKFAPLSIPMQRRLQTLAAGSAVMLFLFGGVVGTFLLVYLIFFTYYWPEAIIYLIWIFALDNATSDRGGRRIEWVREWKWWKYMKDYFPIRVERVPWVELDPKRNYLFCCFPHGILPNGAFSTFCCGFSDFHSLFPQHTPHLMILKMIFYFPLLRDLVLATGMCSVTSESLNYILERPQGGNVAAVIIGGAEETFYAKPGHYNVVLKKRKGFIRIALKNGAPLVPVFSFGEIDVYNQISNPKGSVVRRVQEWVKDLTGVAFAMPMGRGFLQYSFGIVPLRKPISTIGNLLLV